ncbi:hypothetical protein ABEW34_11910 [Paenibacillus algorifonticola]|uniref:hypothetical protein n=1 Tax=Paenibacillus algorifonticola TaxID=684063 RepID=UPI003D29DB54
MLKAIEIDHLFRCVVVKQGAEFKQFSNVLFHQEYYSSVDEEDYEYYLGFTDRDFFRVTLLNEIKRSIKENGKMYICIVCGYDGLDYPQRDELGYATQCICPCCGFQSGFHDDAMNEPMTIEEFRDLWIREGAV